MPRVAMRRTCHHAMPRAFFLSFLNFSALVFPSCTTSKRQLSLSLFHSPPEKTFNCRTKFGIKKKIKNKMEEKSSWCVRWIEIIPGRYLLAMVNQVKNNLKKRILIKKTAYRGKVQRASSGSRGNPTLEFLLFIEHGI